MAVAPRLPKLAPADMAWARWVTQNVAGNKTAVERLDGRINTANTQRASLAGAQGATNQTTRGNSFAGPSLPVGDPQTPTAPQLSTDHGTVTIRWDGQVNSSGVISDPAQGFAYVTVERSSDNGATYTVIGNRLGIAGTLVDADVVVGQTYFYRLRTTDTLARTSTASDVLSIVVKGVDLGSLDQDVQDTLDDIRHSATTGGLIVYSPTAPTDDKYKADAALWFDTSDPNGAVPKRWDAASLTWVGIPYGADALGPGSIVASKILAGAIDTYHLGASIVTAEKIGAEAVTTEKLQANSVVTNKIAVGAIDADRIAVGAIDAKKLSLNASMPAGTQVNRVPRPFSDTGYWSSVIDLTVDLTPHNHTDNRATSTTGGIVFSNPGGTMPITTELSIPISRQLHTQWVGSGDVSLRIITYNSSWGIVRNDALPNDGVYAFNPGEVRYAVYGQGTSSTLLGATVFEVIGGVVGSKQAAQLSPSGLRLFNDSGQLAVDLSTSTTNFFTILNNTESVLTLDENGNGNFNAIQVNDDFYFQGEQVLGDYPDLMRADGPMDGPLLERLPSGVHYAATWTSMDEFTVNSRYQRIATGAFQLRPDRTYVLNADLGGLQTTDTSGVNLYVELQLSTAPLTDVTTGTPVMRSVVYNTNNGYFSLDPSVWTSPTGAGFDRNARTLPPNTDIYWQINTNLSANPTGSYKFNQYTNSAGFTIMDMGPSITILDGTDRTTTGATATGSAGSGSGGAGAGTGGGGTSTTTTKTKTWNAVWTASWNQGGSSRVSGSGTYTDGNMLYQGFGASNMGSKFGFSTDVANTLSGKTVTKVEVFLQNRWTYYNAGGTATFAPHNNGSAGSTFGSTNGSTFTRHFDRGQGRWFTISNSEIPFSSWKSGSTRGLALVVQGGSGNYAYYDGNNKSKPPKLRITYK